MTILIPGFFSTDMFASTSFKVKGNSSELLFNGESIWLNGFSVSGNSYYDIITLAEKFYGTSSNFNVVYNNKNNSIDITTGKNYIPIKNRTYTYFDKNRTYNIKQSTRKIYVNSKLVKIKTYSYNGVEFFNPQDISKLIPFDIEYDTSRKLMALYTKIPQNAFRTTEAFNPNVNPVANSSWQSGGLVL